MSDAPADRPSPTIAEHAVIGNLHTAALVATDGTLDFLSYPRFDSATVCAALLDPQRGGGFRVASTSATARRSQTYEPDSAVLVTRHADADGVLEVTDFMRPTDDERHCQIFRRARCVAGEVELVARLELRYPYGAEAVPFTPAGHVHEADLGPHRLAVYAEGMRLSPAAESGDELVGTVHLSSEDEGSPRECWLVLQSASCAGPEDGDVAGFGESHLAATRDYWRAWSARVTYRGVYRGPVLRSAITLKLCTSATHGSSVAAPTFGLPEQLGGELNWDYRYAWIRDSAFTMYAFLRLGLTDEASAFVAWIERRCCELDDASELGLMYRVDGGRDLEEYELEHLSGYRDSRPVRVGNGAAGQHQLDIYGELIDTVYLYDHFAHPITFSFWRHLRDIVDHVCGIWRDDDHGIWEERGEKHAYTSSKVLAWVAIDRGLRIAEHRGFPCDRERWTASRDELYEYLYDEQLRGEPGRWTQHAGTDAQDASLLLLPLVRFVTADEPVWLDTLNALERELVRGGLVMRYRRGDAINDGVTDAEGYFAVCSFWYVEVLAKSGRVHEAQRIMEQLLSGANEVGLFAEEWALDGRQLGNFPQALTHLGLISAALQLEEQLGGEDCGDREGPSG